MTLKGRGTKLPKEEGGGAVFFLIAQDSPPPGGCLYSQFAKIQLPLLFISAAIGNLCYIVSSILNYFTNA